MLQLKKIDEWVCKAPQRHPPWKAGKAAHSLTCSAWCKFIYEGNKCLRNQIYCHGALACCASLPRLSVPEEALLRLQRGFSWGSCSTGTSPRLPDLLAPWGWKFRACRLPRLPEAAIHLQVPSNIASNSKSTMDDKHMLLVKMFRQMSSDLDSLVYWRLTHLFGGVLSSK